MPSYKSPLEQWTANELEKEGIAYQYEPYSVELLPPFSHSFKSVEGKTKAKTYKPTSGKVRSISYTPDFVGNGWVMETKGHRTADFDLRWKLFKYVKRDEDFLLLLPRNRKQVLESISLIKTLPNVLRKNRSKGSKIRKARGALSKSDRDDYTPQL